MNTVYFFVCNASISPDEALLDVSIAGYLFEGAHSVQSKRLNHPTARDLIFLFT